MTLRNFDIFVSEGFSMLAFCAIADAIAATNMALNAPVYSWQVISHDGGAIPSDSFTFVSTRKGLPVSREVGSRCRSNVIVVLATTTNLLQRRALVSLVRKEVTRGTKVISTGAATMLLAEEGILDERRCAIHWKAFSIAVESYPRVKLTRAYYEIDGPFCTFAGAVSAFDLLLRIIELDFGRVVAEQVSGELLHSSIRGQAARQKQPIHMRLERAGSPLLAVVEIMENNLSDPVSIDEIIEKSKVSRRRIERLFQRHMGMSPKRFYLGLRLERALELVKYSSSPIVDIAVASGFVSASHFSKTFKSHFGYSPKDCRSNECLEANIGWGQRPASCNNLG